LTVTPVNDAPGIVLPDAFEFSEDGLLAVDFTPYFNDIDSDTSLVLTATDNVYINVAIDTFSVTFTADSNWNGFEDIVFTIDDQDLRFTDSDTVRVSVLAVNDAPVITALDSVTITEDSFAEVNLVASDVDGDSLTFIASSTDTSVTVTVSIDTLILTPEADWTGSSAITVFVTDGSLSDTTSFVLTVTPINDAPMASETTISLDEDSTYTGTLFGTDVEGDDMTFSILTNPVNGTISLNDTSAGAYTYSPNEDFNGSDSLSYIVSEGTLSDTGQVNIVVNAINDTPVISVLADTTIDEDGAIDIVLTASDIDEDALTFSASADTSAVIASVSTDTLSVSLVDNWNGSSTLMVVVSDGSATDTTSFELTVNAVNDAPSSFALNEQDSVYITMANFDSDSIVFTWDESADIDDDELSYHFTAELVINNQLTTEYDTTLTANVMKIDYKSVFDEIYAAQSMVAGIEWDVSVSDGVEEVMAENGPLTVGINASDAVLSIDEELLPDKFALHQNYPNPFNPITTLRYDLPENSLVNIIIYDLLGRQVKSLINQTQEAGYKSVLWNATNNYGKPVSAGVYLYQIQAGEFVQTKKMVLLK